jgi:hypothetical protein
METRAMWTSEGDVWSESLDGMYPLVQNADLFP